MTDPVNAWKQTGRVFLWRYPPHKQKCAGWHYTAEDMACEAVIALIDAMRAKPQDSRRTIAISRPSPDIWGVPNFGEPRKESLDRLTISYHHLAADFSLTEDGDRLLLRIGDARIGDLLTGLRDVRQGKGDYALIPREKGAGPSLWFWWMPWSGRR